MSGFKHDTLPTHLDKGKLCSVSLLSKYSDLIIVFKVLVLITLAQINTSETCFHLYFILTSAL